MPLQAIRQEGRYRVFADLKRHRGAFPQATWTRADGGEREVIVWCSNDYLGQGQNPVVLEAMHKAHRRGRRRLGRHAQHLRHHPLSRRAGAELADLHGKEAALLFTSGYVSNEATLATLQKILPGLIIFSDALNHASMIAGIRHGGGDKQIFRHNDLEHLEELLRGAPIRRAQADRLRERLFHGRRHRRPHGPGGAGQAVRRHDLPRRGPCGRHVRPARRRRRRARRRDGPRSTSSKARWARRSA